MSESQPADGSEIAAAGNRTGNVSGDEPADAVPTAPQAEGGGWASPGATSSDSAAAAATRPAFPTQPGHGYNHAYPGQPPYQAPYAQAAPAPDPAAVQRRRRRMWVAASAVAALGLISAGIYVLLPGRTGNSVVTAVNCRPADLTSCLIKAPAGAELLSSSDGDQWPQQTSSTADLYAANITTGSTGFGNQTASLLKQDGLKTIVHTDWNAVDGDDVDIVLLGFDSQSGAKAWNSTRAAEILATYPGPTVAVPGDSTDTAHAASKADSKGNFGAGFTTVVGRIVLDVTYSSPNKLNSQDLRNWAGTELASLHTAPAAAADPATPAPGHQQVACGSGIESCLAATPSGGQPWTSSADSHWISGHSLTPSQLAHLLWDDSSSATQQQVLSDFTSDGVTGVAHTDWSTEDAYKQADIYLVQTITAAGAQALENSDFGSAPNFGDGLTASDYTIPDESGAEAWRTGKTDSSGFIDFAYTATIGNVVVMGWEYFYGSFDAGTANTWAQAQLDKIKASVKTEPMGLFSLTTPKLPAASERTCTSTVNCLMRVPSGATDTTTTSSYYQGVQNLGASAYVNEYESSLADDMTSWLTADGFSTAEHHAWTASNGATADAVLLKYRSPAQAQAAALLEFGINASGDRVCTAKAVPNSLCLAAPVSTEDYLQPETIRVLAWKGDYEVSISVTLSNSADLLHAYTWAEQQLDMLPAS